MDSLSENDKTFLRHLRDETLKQIRELAVTDASSKSPQSNGSPPKYCPWCGQLMVANQATELTPIPTSSTPKMAGDSNSIAKPGPTSS